METTEKDVVATLLRIIDSGRPEGLDEVCAPDLVGHAGAGSDLHELKAAIGSFLAPFPDMTAGVRYLVQEGDLVSSWISYTATHAATSPASPPAAGT